MNILVVDLASKFSAWQVQSLDGRVLDEGDSRGLSSFQQADVFAEVAGRHEVGFILIEDVPYRISRQSLIKAPLRFQGVVMHALRDYIDCMWFINPQSWQKAYPGVAKGDPKDRIAAASAHAERLGYTPPDLVAEYVATLPEGTRVLKKNTDPLVKNMTDYVDTFLMGHWVRSFSDLAEVTKQSGVQPPYI